MAQQWDEFEGRFIEIEENIKPSLAVRRGASVPPPQASTSKHKQAFPKQAQASTSKHPSPGTPEGRMKGGKARLRDDPKRRREIALRAAKVRWNRGHDTKGS
jgi:hypothetical protein